VNPGDTGGELGDLLLEIRALLAGAAPLLVDTAAQAEADGVDLRLGTEPSDVIAAFRLPELPPVDRDGADRTTAFEVIAGGAA
jgi:methionyl-tRNA synthetase